MAQLIILAFIIWAICALVRSVSAKKKEKQRIQTLMESIAVGDAVLTSSGFYGVVIDITDEDVIVEFGSNRNCRIPMKKAAIQEVEKQD